MATAATIRDSCGQSPRQPASTTHTMTTPAMQPVIRAESESGHEWGRRWRWQELETIEGALGGLVAVTLLPLFHFQLFFLLLESMGGNAFVAFLCWALVPSITTRVPGVQKWASLRLPVLRVTAASFLSASFAAGAAGLVTVRLAMSAAGLAIAWGFCQIPLWGGTKGVAAVDGLLTGNHVVLLLHFAAGMLPPPSPGVRFLQSVPLPILLLAVSRRSALQKTRSEGTRAVDRPPGRDDREGLCVDPSSDLSSDSAESLGPSTSCRHATAGVVRSDLNRGSHSGSENPVIQRLELVAAPRLYVTASEAPAGTLPFLATPPRTATAALGAIGELRPKTLVVAARGGGMKGKLSTVSRSVAASLASGCLLFLTILLASSPWTGDDWAPTPCLGTRWAVLRQSSVVLGWGIGRTLVPSIDSSRRRAPASCHRWRNTYDRARRAWPGLAVLFATSALALSPNRAVVVVPGLFAASVALPPLWHELERCSSTKEDQGGNDGAVVYTLLTVWETALVAFEYAPPLRYLRGTRAVLMASAALVVAARVALSSIPPSISQRPPSRGLYGVASAEEFDEDPEGLLDAATEWRNSGDGAFPGAPDDDGFSGQSSRLAVSDRRVLDTRRTETPPIDDRKALRAVGRCSCSVGDDTSAEDVTAGSSDSRDAVSVDEEAASLRLLGVFLDERQSGPHDSCPALRTTREAAATGVDSGEEEPGIFDAGGRRCGGPAGIGAVLTLVITAGLTLSAPHAEGGLRKGSGVCFGERGGTTDGKREASQESQVRVVNFNVYMGYDRKGEDNTFRVGRMLKGLRADVATLQETGLMRLTLGNRRYAGAVARASGMIVAAAAPVAEDTWGCAILTRLPVISWGWWRLPRGVGENACEAHATLSLGHGQGFMTVVNVHLGNQGTEDNEQQVDGLLSLLAELFDVDAEVHRSAVVDSRIAEETLWNARQPSALRMPSSRAPRTIGPWWSRLHRVLQQQQQQPHYRQDRRSQDHPQRPLVLAGDFNFDSNSTGYRRLVEDGGLEPAVAREGDNGHVKGSTFVSIVDNGDETDRRGTLLLREDNSNAAYDATEERALGKGGQSWGASVVGSVEGDRVRESDSGTRTAVRGATATQKRRCPHGPDEDFLITDGKAPGGDPANLRREKKWFPDSLTHKRRRGRDKQLARKEDSASGEGASVERNRDSGVSRTVSEDLARSGGHGSSGGTSGAQSPPPPVLDFVFFRAPAGDVVCTRYKVHREFSQERYADGYPAVADFDLCPLP